jgi:ComF family protein
LDSRSDQEQEPDGRLFPLSYRLYHLLWIALDLLLPPRCGGCGRPGSRWCADCQAQVVLPPSPLCAVCGLPVPSHARLCIHCRTVRPGFIALRAWSSFEGPVRRALHQLKYRRDIGFAESVTPQLSGRLEELHWPLEVVVPVPLAPGRQNERGYNQAGLIARPLSMALGLRYDARALVRRRETRSQVGLSRAERHANVRGAFEAARRRVSGRKILLLDDVATTGATLSAGADALYAAGASAVYAFTLARALDYRSMGGA